MTMFDHDFENYPELTNTQLEVLSFISPHKQIVSDFSGRVVKVQDGDTITLRVDFRDFDFPLRLLNINSPEKGESGGEESTKWLEGQILDEDVEIRINPKQRVGKYGRLLGEVIHKGQNMNDMSMNQGYSVDFDSRNDGKIPRFDQVFAEVKI